MNVAPLSSTTNHALPARSSRASQNNDSSTLIDINCCDHGPIRTTLDHEA